MQRSGCRTKQPTIKAMTKKRALFKAYEDPEFMTSFEARQVRILTEYLMPLSHFEKLRVKDTIVFFVPPTRTAPGK